MTPRGQSCVLIALLAAATAPATAQKLIPVRALGPAVSTDSGVIASVYMLHGRSSGSVLVNDTIMRRLLLFDSTLKHFKIVADTAGKAANRFGNGRGGLLPFYGDSTAFIDRESQVLVVVGRAGDFGRITTPPRVADMGWWFGGGAPGQPGFDLQGRLYYGAPLALPTPPSARASQAETTYVVVDSAPILRADFDVRRIDTVAMAQIPRLKFKVIRTGGSTFSRGLINPLPLSDDWVYFADGTVAVVRGQDYHVDWFLPDGARKSTPRMPFDWRRVTEEEKQRMVDSTRHVLDSVSASSTRAAGSFAVPPPSGSGGRVGAGGGTPAPIPAFMVATPEVLKVEELPDYYPAIRASGQARVDPEGNIWILPATSIQARGGLLYDVVNRSGEIVERVQIPAGRTLQGFGPGGLVYMSVPATMQARHDWPRVERARVIRP